MEGAVVAQPLPELAALGAQRVTLGGRAPQVTAQRAVAVHEGVEEVHAPGVARRATLVQQAPQLAAHLLGLGQRPPRLGQLGVEVAERLVGQPGTGFGARAVVLQLRLRLLQGGIRLVEVRAVADTRGQHFLDLLVAFGDLPVLAIAHIGEGVHLPQPRRRGVLQVARVRQCLVEGLAGVGEVGVRHRELSAQLLTVLEDRRQAVADGRGRVAHGRVIERGGVEAGHEGGDQLRPLGVVAVHAADAHANRRLVGVGGVESVENVSHPW